MLTLFLWLVLVVNSVLALIWSKGSWQDVMVKLALIVISLLCVCLLLKQYGFLVRV